MADDELLLVPRVPDALLEAARLGTLIPFVGAGVSRLAGCPDWAELADRVLRCLVDQGGFSHAQLAQVDGLPPRVKLSLALGLQEELELKIDFKALLHPVDRKDHATGRRLYTILSKFARTFVTTNYDEWLDEELAAPPLSVDGDTNVTTEPVVKARTVFHEPKDLTAANLNGVDTVLHLHGSLRNPNGMIITTREYVRHYANDRRREPSDPENPVLTFLEDLFRTKTVLFVGYGLDELEILEYVILKTSASKTRGLQPRHFIVQGFFSHERELMLSLKRYYRGCGIELLPFLKDQKGWDQLVDVLDEFARRLPVSPLAVLQELNDMEGLLDD